MIPCPYTLEEEIPTQQVEGGSINTSISVNNCTLVQGKTQAPNAGKYDLNHNRALSPQTAIMEVCSRVSGC